MHGKLPITLIRDRRDQLRAEVRHHETVLENLRPMLAKYEEVWAALDSHEEAEPPSRFTAAQLRQQGYEVRRLARD